MDDFAFAGETFFAAGAFLTGAAFFVEGALCAGRVATFDAGLESLFTGAAVLLAGGGAAVFPFGVGAGFTAAGLPPNIGRGGI